MDMKKKTADYEFFEAIRNSDFAKVKRMAEIEPLLINKPASKKPSDTRFMSPLQAALCTGYHKEIAWFLLESGADVNYRAEKKLCSDAYPVLFDAVNAAVWNARRFAWDGVEAPTLNMVWKHTKEESDAAFALLKRMIELGADVNKTDYYNRNSLMEAVAEANKLCPIKNNETGEYYPGRTMTDEMREDFRRIFILLIDSGADRENTSSYSKQSRRQHYEGEFIWQVCGDLF